MQLGSKIRLGTARISQVSQEWLCRNQQSAPSICMLQWVSVQTGASLAHNMTSICRQSVLHEKYILVARRNPDHTLLDHSTR